MKQLLIFSVLFFGAVYMLHGQAWSTNGVFTEHAKREFHRVFGSSMGFENPEETLRFVDSVRIHGKYANKQVRNSGVGPAGIKMLAVGTFSVTYLGSTDATYLEKDKVGYTANLYLKEGCANLGWTLTAPTPTSPPPPKVEKGTVVITDTIRNTVVIDTTIFRTNVVEETYYPEPAYTGVVRGGYVTTGGYTTFGAYNNVGGWCPPQIYYKNKQYCPPRQQVCGGCGRNPCGCRQQVRQSPRQNVCGGCGRNPCGCRTRGGGQVVSNTPPQNSGGGVYYGPRTDSARTGPPRRPRG